LEILLILITSVSRSLLDNIVLKWHVFAIAILIGWFELVLLSGRLPQLSVQLEMFRTITVTFLKIIEKLRPSAGDIRPRVLRTFHR